MFTTALVIRVGERLICLYYSGRAHAGENLATLLEQREADLEPPLAMSDALSRNEVEEGLVIRCHCLAHGRRQFSDIEAVFPTECRVVLDALKQVFDHDEEAREKQLSAQARLTYHQTYSQPLMDDLKSWLDNQIADRLVEPHSSLGQAITYMQTHWETLGCLNRPSAVARFLASSCRRRLCHLRWSNIFNHTRGLLGRQRRPILMFIIH